MIGVLFIFLLFSSAAILYTTAQNVYSVQSLALQSLQSTAFSLAKSVENVLSINNRFKMGEIREIFSDRVVAYALILEKDGKISFHTNPALIGSSLSWEQLERSSKADTLSGRRIVLQTGIPAYEFDYLVHASHGSVSILRLVLHTTPADLIISKAKRMWWTVGTVLIILWTTGLLLGFMFLRYVRLQAQLERRKQMALIGQMTAVLAHEIRNALASIKGYTQLVDEKTPPSDSRKENLEAVLTGVGRIESLVDSLLLFSKDEVYDIKPVEVMAELRETLKLVLPFWEGKVEYEGKIPVYAKADKEKLSRVIANGIRNAVEAMGENGVLRISTCNDGGQVIIKIEDTGTGIPEKAIPEIFTPFYTTKADGTGLGLSYSEKLVKGMRGQIDLSNRDDRTGAVLTIRLPIAQEPTP